MSEIQKPVEDPVPVVAETTAVEPLKAEETAPAAATETPAVVEPSTETTEPTAAAVETPAAPVETPKKEFDGSGTLGYKAPGGFIKKLAGFQRKFFWLQDEPISHKNLTSYLRGEKPEVGNHNAAWSSTTGKGLLYFSKHASEKSTPAGVINLADVSDIKDDGTVDFLFHYNGQKHVFQATSSSEQTSWVSLLKAKVEEAKAAAEGIKNSEEYKKEHSSLSKPVLPVAVAAVTPKPVEAKVEAKKEEKAEAKEEKKEEKAEKKEEKKEEKTRKSRSASRKRNSIFGTFGFKKEEHAEKKEEKKAETAEATPAVEPTTEAAVVEDAAPVETAPVVDEPAKTETPVVAKEEARPAATNKRNSSIFGSFSKFGSKKEAKTEAPVVPAKDETATSSEAPVIPAVETTEPLATSVASPATVPTETTAITNGATPAAVEPETKTETKPSEKRKSSLPFGLKVPKKEKDIGSESEGEKPKSPSAFAKIRQTIKSKTSPRAAAAEKPVEPKAEEAKAEETPAATEPATEEAPVVSEPISAAPVSTPQVSATA